MNIWVVSFARKVATSTAGLDMPKFFRSKSENWDLRAELSTSSRSPTGVASRSLRVQGIVYTIGIDDDARGDIVIAADDCRFCQMESKRGIAPFGVALSLPDEGGWVTQCPIFFYATSLLPSGQKIGLVQEVVPEASRRARHAGRGNNRQNAPIGIKDTKEAALKFIESGEQAAVDYIPKIKDRVFNSEDFKRESVICRAAKQRVPRPIGLSAQNAGCSTN